MKRLIGCVLTAILCLAPGAVWAAGAGSSDDTSTTETHTRTTYSSSSTSSTDTHRYVSGEAAKALQPNFLDNDWDEGTAGLNNLTSAERSYLKSVTGLRNGVKYYIDMSSKTVGTSAFSDSSTTSTSTSTSTTTPTSTVAIGDAAEVGDFVLNSSIQYITTIVTNTTMLSEAW